VFGVQSATKSTKLPEPSRVILAEPQPEKSEEEIKEVMKKIYTMIPQEKEDIFKFSIDWMSFVKSNLLERKVRPWLVQRSIEYLG